MGLDQGGRGGETEAWGAPRKTLTAVTVRIGNLQNYPPRHLSRGDTVATRLLTTDANVVSKPSDTWKKIQKHFQAECGSPILDL